MDIFKAIEERDLKTVEILGKRGKHVNKKNKHGVTALICAIAKGDKAIVRTLLDYGAKVDAQDALFQAYEMGRGSIMELLIERGADVNKQFKNHASIIRENAFVGTLLMYVAWEGNKDRMNVLLKRGARIDEKNPNGMTALMLASANGHEPVVELLLERGANVNQKDNAGNTALMWAVARHSEHLLPLFKKYSHLFDEKERTLLEEMVEFEEIAE